jgi:hypothetical protein
MTLILALSGESISPQPSLESEPSDPLSDGYHRIGIDLTELACMDRVRQPDPRQRTPKPSQGDLSRDAQRNAAAAVHGTSASTAGRGSTESGRRSNRAGGPHQGGQPAGGQLPRSGA